MHDRERLALCPPDADRERWTLDVGRMHVVDEVSSFDAGIPAGWTPDQPACWSVEDGRLVGTVAGANGTFLWRDEPIAGGHAIRYRGAAVPAGGAPADWVALNGNLNCMWNSLSRAVWNPATGDMDGTTWSLTVSGFAGWWSGASGIEYLGGADAPPSPVGHAVARLEPLVPGRTYDLVAGRCRDRDFLFIDGTLVMEVLGPGIVRPERAHVAVATFGTERFPARIEVERITAYQVPDDLIPGS